MNAGRFRHLRTPQIDRERLGDRLRDVVGYAQSIDAREQLQPALDRVGELSLRRRRSHRRRNAILIVAAVFIAGAVAALVVQRMRRRARPLEAEPAAIATEPTADASDIGATNGSNGAGEVAGTEVQHAASG